MVVMCLTRSSKALSGRVIWCFVVAVSEVLVLGEESGEGGGERVLDGGEASLPVALGWRGGLSLRVRPGAIVSICDVRGIVFRSEGLSPRLDLQVDGVGYNVNGSSELRRCRDIVN